jgi:hypothetical protein
MAILATFDAVHQAALNHAPAAGRIANRTQTPGQFGEGRKCSGVSLPLRKAHRAPRLRTCKPLHNRVRSFHE